jgi:WD40 repeat protein
LNNEAKAIIWELKTPDVTKHYLHLNYKKFENALFTKDNRYLITLKQAGNDVAEVWNIQTDSVHVMLGNRTDVIKNFALSDSGYKVALGSPKGVVSVWDAATGRELWRKKYDGFSTSNFLVFSPDNQWLIAGSSGGGIFRVINANTGEEMWKDERIDPGYIEASMFSPDGQQLYCFTNRNLFLKKEIRTGRDVLKFDAGNYKLEDYSYTSNLLLVSNNSGEKKLINLKDSKQLYSFYAIDSLEYLVKDMYGRYDGTYKARTLLYFTCGTEVIGLDQVKESLWVPNLAKRIMIHDTI